MKRLREVIVLCLVLVMAISSTVVCAESKKNVTKSFKDIKKVTKLVDQLTTPIGYQFLYTDKELKNEKITLDGKFMMDTAGMGLMRPTLKKLHKATQDIYGKKPSVKNLKTFKDEDAFYEAGVFVGRTKGGKIYTLTGDWGLAAPETKVVKVTKLSKTTYQVDTEMNFHDYEDDIVKPLGNIKFVVKKNADSKYGYVITAITVNRAK